MAAGTTVLYTSDGAVGRITLNRPAQRNALSSQLAIDLGAALDEFEDDPTAKVGILSGNGPSFCAGFDLSSRSASVASTVDDPWGDRNRLRGWIELGLRIWSSPRPVVAQIHGHCIAGGVLFALCADIVFTTETCVFGWPRLPVGAGFQDAALALLVGARRAKQLSYIVGSRIDGREAERWGLANFACPADDLDAETERFATRVAMMPRTAIEIRKAAINRATDAFAEALLAGAEWDAIAHADPEMARMRRAVKEAGLKAAIEAFEGGTLGSDARLDMN